MSWNNAAVSTVANRYRQGDPNTSCVVIAVIIVYKTTESVHNAGVDYTCCVSL